MIKKVFSKKIIPLILALLVLCSCSQGAPPVNPQNDEQPTASSVPVSQAVSAPTLSGEALQVFIFDVGQADCVLVKTEEHAMLIDAGDIGQENFILGYLYDNGVTNLDYLVATHPHSDHIGSMAGVIRELDYIGALLMPDAIHTTNSFEKLLDAIEDKDIPVTIPNPGDTLQLGNALVQILAPVGAGYDDLNNYSIVLRIEYGQAAFLFTGDAEDISEGEQLAADFTVNADVLKVGHHGSNSSTTQRYLDAVSPSYAVISCGKDNSYGHPSDTILSRLSNSGVAVYRTDKNGTVSFITDGNTITVITEREPNDSDIAAPDTSAMLIGNLNSNIFHLPSCGTLPAEKNRVYFSTRDEAISAGYRGCKNCNP